MHLKDIEVGRVGNHLAHMHRVAMSKACGIEQIAVVVEGSRSPEDFVAAVAVHISHTQVMVAVAIEGVTAAAVGSVGDASRIEGSRLERSALKDVAVNGHLGPRLRIIHLRCKHQRLCGIGRGMEPLGMQALTVEAHCPDVGLGIVAAAEDSAGRLVGTVEVGHGGKIAFRSVAVVVAPETAGIGHHLTQV